MKIGMQSLFKQLSVFTKVSIALVLLIAVSFTSYLYLGGKSQRSTQDYRTILTFINSSISTLHDLELEQRGPEESEELQAVIEKLILTISHSEYRFVLKETRMHEKWRSEFQGAPSEMIECLGRVARMVGESYRETRNALYHWSIANAVIFFALTLSMLVWLIISRKAMGSFVATISNSIGQLQNLIAYREYDISVDPHWQEEREFLETIKHISTELSTDRSLSEMNVASSLEEFLPKFKKLVDKNIPCNRLALAFISPYGDITAESAVTDLNVLYLEPGFVEPIAQTTLDVVVNSAYPRIINDIEAYYNTVHKSEATELILKEGLNSSLTAPIIINGKTIGFLFINSVERNAYTEHHIYHALQLVNPLRQNIYYQYLLQQVIAETAKSFVVLMEKKDNETSLHIARMSLYSYNIAKKLFEQDRQINSRFMREILWFAPLHDIGKIGIPDNILLKPGKLTEDEFEIMKQHVTIGEHVITKMDEALTATANLRTLKTAIDLISSHHERWDGKGYPRGLAGRDIPLSGRIVAIADVFDALTSRRPYKEAFSLEKTLGIMRSSVGTQFDPWVFNAFEATLPEILKIYEEYKEV
jgi:HD-GYP domain-containing protein (c-di-GMP phosphodiesterase class II)